MITPFIYLLQGIILSKSIYYCSEVECQHAVSKSENTLFTLISGCSINVIAILYMVYQAYNQVIVKKQEAILSKSLLNNDKVAFADTFNSILSCIFSKMSADKSEIGGVSCHILWKANIIIFYASFLIFLLNFFISLEKIKSYYTQQKKNF